MNIKKLLGIVIGVALVGWILYSNIQQQETQSNGKRNVYVVLPLSGVRAEAGKSMQKATDVYMKENNPSYNLIYVDSGDEPSRAVTALQQATINEKEPVVISVMTNVSSALIANSNFQNAFIFPISFPEVKHLSQFKNFQRISAGAAQTKTLTDYIAKKHKKVMVLYSISDWGLSFLDKTKNFLNEKKIAFDTIGFDTKNTEVRSMIQKLKQKDFDSILIISTGGPVLWKVYSELFSQEINVPIYGDIVFTWPGLEKILGKEQEKVIFATVDANLDTPTTEQSKKFRQFCLNHNLLPYFDTVEILDALYLIDEFNKNKIPFNQSSFQKLGLYKLYSGNIQFLENGNSEYEYKLARMKDGKIVPVEE